MDNIKTLMEKQNYELVIKITEKSEDIDDNFYRISSFIALGKPLEALSVIKEKRKILEGRLDLLIKIHFQILFLLNRFDEARSELDYYYQLPYYSQVVEEALKDLPREIASKEKEQSRLISIWKYIDDTLLTSSKDEDIISAIELIKDEDLFHYITKLQNILSGDKFSRTTKNYIIFRCIRSKINHEFLYKIKDGEIIKINPLNTTDPFQSELFNQVLKNIHSINKNPVLVKNMTEVLLLYISNLFPYDFEGDSLVIFFALKLIGCDLLKEDNAETLDEIEKAEISLKNVMDYKNKIKEFL
ncbi:MAG: hypothetical protein ACI31G_01155 [Bacilli bacterium]